MVTHSVVNYGKVCANILHVLTCCRDPHTHVKMFDEPEFIFQMVKLRSFPAAFYIYLSSPVTYKRIQDLVWSEKAEDKYNILGTWLKTNIDTIFSHNGRLTVLLFYKKNHKILKKIQHIITQILRFLC